LRRSQGKVSTFDLVFFEIERALEGKLFDGFGG
jgi:hypothetical protein